MHYYNNTLLLKLILVFFTLFHCTEKSSAQCGDTKVLSATADHPVLNNATITLVFENESQLDELSFIIAKSYFNSEFPAEPGNQDFVFVNAPDSYLTPGMHTWTITQHQGALIYTFEYLSIYSASLRSNCNGDGTFFPVGIGSITNELGLLLCEDDGPDKPKTILDGSNETLFDTLLVAAPAGTLVNNLEVFINIGHTYTGDLSISLISPAGTTVQLLEFPNELGNSQNFSGFLKDSYPLVGTPGVNFIGSYEELNQGFFRPFSPLGAFNGEELSGNWVLEVRDNLFSDIGILFDWCINPNTPIEVCDSLSAGNVYLDMNANEDFDQSDELLPYELIGYSGNSILFSDANGQFSICDPDSGAYIFNLIPPPYATPLVDTLEITYTTDSLANVSQHYGYSIIENASDLSACGNSTGFPPPRPGFLSTFSTYYAHNGTACAYDVVLTATLTGPVQGTIATSNPNAVITGQTITLEFDSPCPGDWGGLEFGFTVPDTVSLGFQYGLDVSISSSNPDFNPDDNTCFSQATVVAAYDPNDKQVNRSTITPEEVADEIALTYTIRFQNTGNFYAERVVLVDTLPDFLDPLSFQFLETSDPMEISIEDQVLKFTFNDIYLPTEADDPEGSIGYVSFSMRVKPNMLLGDSVANQAGIYFDFNAPIITNFAVTTVDEAVSVSEVSRGDVRIFPNPTQDRIFIQSKNSIKSIRIFDLTGSILFDEKSTGKRQEEIDLSVIEPGIYFIVINSSYTTQIIKL